MFGFIKNLGKKSDNFFLELKEDVEEKIAEIKDDKKEQAPAQASKESKPVAITAPTEAPAPATASSNGKMTRKEAAAAAKASKIEAAKKARAEQEAEAKPKDASELAAAAVGKKPEVQTPQETGFATKYLMTPSTNGRRRPGPNMNSFLEMASKVKKPTEK